MAHYRACWVIEVPTDKGYKDLKSGGRTVFRLSEERAIETAEHEAGLSGVPYKVSERNLWTLDEDLIR